MENDIIGTIIYDMESFIDSRTFVPITFLWIISLRMYLTFNAMYKRGLFWIASWFFLMPVLCLVFYSLLPQGGIALALFLLAKTLIKKYPIK